MGVEGFIAIIIFNDHIVAIAAVIGRFGYSAILYRQDLRSLRYGNIQTVVHLHTSGRTYTVAVIAADEIAPVVGDRGAKELPVAFRFRVNLIKLGLVIIQPTGNDGFKAFRIECDVTHLDRFRGRDFYFGGAIGVGEVGCPCLMPMRRCRRVGIIVDIEIHAVLIKVSGVLHGVFHTVHDHLCPNGDDGVGSINGNGVVCLRVNAAGSWTACPLAAADGAVAIAACHDFAKRFTDTDGLCDGSGFIYNFLGIAILQGEQGIKLIFDGAIKGEIPILRTQIADQDHRVMPDGA